MRFGNLEGKVVNIANNDIVGYEYVEVVPRKVSEANLIKIILYTKNIGSKEILIKEEELKRLDEIIDMNGYTLKAMGYPYLRENIPYTSPWEMQRDPKGFSPILGPNYQDTMPHAAHMTGFTRQGYTAPIEDNNNPDLKEQ